MADFGITFRNAREAKGLTLEEVAAKTKIGTRFLEAIEQGQLERLPGGIFSRGFVRAYAECLGLDVDEAVADFDRLSNYRSPSAAIEEKPIVTAKPAASNPKLFPIAIVVLIIIIIVFYVATRRSATSVTSDRPAAEAVVQQPKPNAEATAAPAPTAPPEAAPAPEPPPKEALALVLEAREATWVKVLADGAAVNPGETLKPGTTRRYTAQNSIDLTVGNARGIDVRVNDRQIRTFEKGSGKVQSLTITTENLKDITE